MYLNILTISDITDDKGNRIQENFFTPTPEDKCKIKWRWPKVDYPKSKAWKNGDSSSWMRYVTKTRK